LGNRPITYVGRALDFLWLCCGYGTRRPSNLEAFCEGLERSTQLFIMNLAWKCLYDQCRYTQDSDGGRKHRTCVRCMQGVCGGFGTRRPSNQEAFFKTILNTR
jgi:hypothetical protein